MASSRVALDLPNWAMHSALYRLIRMAIEMASEISAFFSVVNFMTCTNVAQQLNPYGCRYVSIFLMSSVIA